MEFYNGITQYIIKLRKSDYIFRRNSECLKLN